MSCLRDRLRSFRRSDRFYAIVLGLFIAIGPLGIDMYLPAFPDIARDLHVHTGLVQLSLVTYFFALAFGQLVYGPLSDRLGRRAPLLAGTIAYIATSLAITQVTEIHWLIALRFIQGLGGCAGTTTARAILRDVATGERAAKLYSRMILVFGAAPILAPALGSLVLLRFHWEALFYIMAAYGAFVVVLVLFVLEETLPRERRAVHARTAFSAYGMLLRQPPFLMTLGIGGCMQAAFFAYLAGSPYVFITLHHLSSLQYGMLFGANAVALIAASQCISRIIARIGAVRMVRFAALCATASAIVLLVISGPHAAVAATAACVFIIVTCQGLVSPATSLMAMEPYPAVAGAASALIGMSLYAFGTASAALVSVFFNGTAYPMAAMMVLCTAASATLAVIRRGR